MDQWVEQLETSVKTHTTQLRQITDLLGKISKCVEKIVLLYHPNDAETSVINNQLLESPRIKLGSRQTHLTSSYVPKYNGEEDNKTDIYDIFGGNNEVICTRSSDSVGYHVKVFPSVFVEQVKNGNNFNSDVSLQRKTVRTSLFSILQHQASTIAEIYVLRGRQSIDVAITIIIHNANAKIWI